MKTRTAAASTSQMARRQLGQLVIAAAIPVLVFAGWVAFLNARQERAAARLAAFEALDSLAARITSEIGTQIELVETLATSASLDEPELPMFYREAKRLKDAHPLWETIELVDTKGRQVLNLLRPMGSELGATADRENFEKVLQTHKAAIGGIGPIGPISGKRLIALRAAVAREGTINFVLTVALVPDAVSQILRNAGAPPGWVGVVVDAKGNIVARTSKEQFELGRPASEAVRTAIRRGPEGSYVGNTLEGTEVDTMYRTLPGTGGWSVHLGIPTESLNAPVRRSAYLLAGGGTISIALAVVLAWLTWRDIARWRREQEDNAAVALSLSEERRVLAIEATELGVFSWNFTKGDVVASRRAQSLLNLSFYPTGKDEHTLPEANFLDGIHPADRQRFARMFRDCVHSGPTGLEFRTVESEGIVRWRRATCRPSEVKQQEQDVVFGVVLDIDATKRADIERGQLLRRLSDAEESERRRIARELHDQIGQSITGLMLGLKRLEQAVTFKTDPEPAQCRITWLQGVANSIGRDIHRLAADLRPTALDDLGLQEAVKALCSEWSSCFQIATDLQFLGDQTSFPADVEIAVYRAIQEALTNVLKHASAHNVSLVVDSRPGELRVVIEDDGEGFRPEERMRSGRERLGLSGMGERLGLIGGSLVVESEPGAGTTLFITVPVKSGKEEE